MRIRTYFFNSFVVHAVFLIYIFSLPLHRTIIQPGPYNAYFVSLQSEGKKTANRSSARGTKKPKVHAKVKDKETRPETKEPIVSKVSESPEEAKPVEKPDDKEREQVEEKPVQIAAVKAPDEFQQVRQPQQEVPALEEKKQEKPKNEVPESKKNETKPSVKETASMPPPPDLSKVDEKKLEPEKREALKEKAVPVEAQETARPQEIEKPLKEIPEGEKPDVKESQKIEEPQNTEAKVSAPLIDQPSTAQEKVSSPEVEKTARSQTAEKISKAEPSLEQNKVVHAADKKGIYEPIAKGKLKMNQGKPSVARQVKNHASSQGLKEASSGKLLGEPAIQGSTIEQTASQEGSSPAHGEGNEQPAIETKEEGQGNTVAEGKKSLVAMPVPEVLIPCDLKIEVALRKPGALRSGAEIQKAPVTAFTTGQSNMPKATEITQISLEEVNDGVKVRIKGNGSMAPKVFPYQNRLVIDIPNVVTKAKLPSNLPPLLKNVRSGKHKDKSRLVLDLNEKLPFEVLSAGDTFTVAVQKPVIKPQVDPDEKEARAKIETAGLNETEISNVTMHLLKNPHPKSGQREKQSEITLLERKRESQAGGKSTIRKAFSVLKTDQGAYTFLVRNEENEPYEADLAFFIFQGRPGERTKKFAAVKLSPHTTVRFKFLLPDAIFWDDEDYFSGKIENSDTVTKFSGKTGLVWKETKDE
jgi:hypothetical protein